MTESLTASNNTATVEPTAAKAAIDQLEVCGITTVFGIPGVHTLALYDALHDSNLTHILARHEQGVGFMADGFARATGQPAVALVITGPGVTNVATPIGQAYTDSSPVFVLSSNVERDHLDAMRGNLHDLKDQRAVMRAVTKWNDRALEPADVPQMIATAYAEMMRGRQLPVHLEIPIDVLDEPVGGFPSVSSEVSESPPVDSAEQIASAAEALASAERPMIYCGGGATSAAAGASILAIAERLGAPIVTSIQGKGSVPDGHPLVCGTFWTQGNAIDDLARQADLLLVVGSKLGVQATERFTFPIPDTLIRIDIDPHEMARNATPSIGIVGDAASVTAQIASDLEARPTSSRWAKDEIDEARTLARQSAFGVDRVAWLEAIRVAVPDDGCIAWDMTMMSYVAGYHFPVYQPRTFLFPSGFGTLGFALPAAIGAKVGLGERTVAAVVGDGGYQFTMQELATAVQFRLGIPVIIFNDSTYSAVKAEQHSSRDQRYSAVDLVNPDYVKLADAYGVPGVRVTSPEALQTAITDALSRDLPTLIDVPIDGWV
ncbi:MAG: thiamine pyrophosphate-binding protein [Chloroflexota bacterium]|nr:thiamine pyrophosphate-binding protein [Chloroflexota bacterium]